MSLTPSEPDEAEPLCEAAKAFVAEFTAVADAASRNLRIWANLEDLYRAPESNDLRLGIFRPARAAGSACSKAERAARALYGYANELEDFRRRYDDLCQRIGHHEAEVSAAAKETRTVKVRASYQTTDTITLAINGVDQALVEQGLALEEEVLVYESDLEQAQITCANALNDAWGGQAYVQSDLTWLGDPHGFGTTVEAKRQSVDLDGNPWGSLDAKRLAQGSGHRYLRSAGMWNSAVETVVGPLRLINPFDPGRAANSWSSL
ncbi:hypothetical protein I6B53_01895 [Schaalia sp. 19OD2882]|uniref:hypothetical protein n=1 Tax=Schaalia sp. 19OD2882 TaxID=2794089 RepID=UPI001C1ECBB0|nr:hypothetical protein [Schaalia sp. 19OD2882]QWW19901.1 hypothetical protein I6B53_01895 [Schaalia sp. 19OD2882]